MNNPKVLLLDEPLGALDYKLRKTMQLELKNLQQRLGITFIYVTHDQEEALTMSDRVIIVNAAASSRTIPRPGSTSIPGAALPPGSSGKTISSPSPGMTAG